MASRLAEECGPLTVCFIDQTAVLAHIPVSPQITFGDFLVVLHDLTKPFAHNLSGLPMIKEPEEGLNLNDGHWWYRVLRAPDMAANLRYVKGVGWRKNSVEPIKGHWQMLNNSDGFDLLVAEVTSGPRAKGAWVEIQHEWQKSRDEGDKAGVPCKRKGPLIVDPHQVAQRERQLSQIDPKFPSAEPDRTTKVKTSSTDESVSPEIQIDQLKDSSKGPKIGVFYPNKRLRSLNYSWHEGQVNHTVTEYERSSRGPKAGLFYPPKHRHTQSQSVNTMRRTFVARDEQTQGIPSSSWSAPVSEQRSMSSYTIGSSQAPTREAPGQVVPFYRQLVQVDKVLRDHQLSRHGFVRHASYVTNPYSDDASVNSSSLGISGPGPSVAASQNSSVDTVQPHLQLSTRTPASNSTYNPYQYGADQSQVNMHVPSMLPNMVNLGLYSNTFAQATQSGLDPALDSNNPEEDIYATDRYGVSRKTYLKNKAKKFKKPAGAYTTRNMGAATVDDAAVSEMTGTLHDESVHTESLPLITSASGNKKKSYSEMAAEMKEELETQRAKQKDARDERAARRESLKSEE